MLASSPVTTPGAARRLVAVFLALLATIGLSSSADAQTTELTSSDRLALLYTSQLNFDPSGEPVVKIGIAEGLDFVSFETSDTVRVLPTGDGGPELVLPAGKRIEVSLEDGRAGRYQHYVVLQRFHPDQSKPLQQAVEMWRKRNVEVRTIDVGSLFAIAGSMFDNRETLLVTKAFDEERDADALRKKLQREHDVVLDLYAELSAHPSGLLELKVDDMSFTLRHRDVLWIDLGAGRAVVDDVPTERGKLEDRTYGHALVFTPDRHGRLALVNAVGAETALRGVVPAEIYSTAPLEALKVQAIAARGTMLSQIGTRHNADPFNLCDEQHCQVFKGLSSAHASTDEAIEATRGAILFDDKRIAETYYSSNSGGISASAHEVWGLDGRRYLRAHMDTADAWSERDGTLQRPVPSTEAELREFLLSEPDAFSNTDAYSSGRNFRWRKRFEADELDAVVAERFPDLGRVEKIDVTSRGPGQRVVTLEITGEHGRRVVERELPVRRLFGGLKSGLFVLDVERDADGRPTAWEFIGGGFGHGVGMDQTGAMGMALEGHTHVDILGHYYHGTRVRGLW